MPPPEPGAGAWSCTSPSVKGRLNAAAMGLVDVDHCSQVKGLFHPMEIWPETSAARIDGENSCAKTQAATGAAYSSMRIT